MESSDSRLQDLFNEAAGKFEGLDGDADVRHFEIGGRLIRIRFGDGQIGDLLTPAINHLAVDELTGKPLTIDVWQSREAPIRLTQDDWRHAVSPLEALGPQDFLYCQPDIGMLVLRRGDRALLCYRDINEVPPWELAIPFRVILNSWFQRDGAQIIHGAAISNQQDAIVLAGVGGSGKSSTALSCLTHPGLFFLADDLCLLSSPGAPMVHSLYNSVKIRRENLSRFDKFDLPELDHLPFDHGKPTYFLHPRLRHKLAVKKPLRAILLPRITNQTETRIRLGSAQDAWRALVPSTFAVVLGDRSVTAKHIAKLTQSLPVFWLELGTGHDQISQCIAEFLANLDASTDLPVPPFAPHE
ncbi:MAG: hypothetical protein P1U68_13360 [Verrucomicrobiales bacterium]|nr:hypothetical protein [Verrucomicrobiales bacterium]